MVCTLAGTVIRVKAHCMSAAVPISRREAQSPRLTDASAMHPEKANSPMLSSPAGSTIEVILVRLLNA